MIEVDGPTHSLKQAVEAIKSAASVDGVISIRGASSPDEVELLWNTRRSLSRHCAMWHQKKSMGMSWSRYRAFPI